MNMIDKHPNPCELTALTAAAISACDPLDGVVDGIISDPATCLDTFDPYSLVGKPIHCSAANTTHTISQDAAAVVYETWHGPSSPSGRQIWYGISPGADITGSAESPGIARTNCTSGTCTGINNFLSVPYFSLLVAKGDPNFNISNLSCLCSDNKFSLKEVLLLRDIHTSAIQAALDRFFLDVLILSTWLIVNLSMSVGNIW